ncbi:MAG: arsenate reductase family protein [Clostridia bacterium]|nr:arsenate reductase family protein [Clostridia bacterium]
MLFIEYPKCTTCKKAKKWLDEHHIEYTDRHIKDENPTDGELSKWLEISGLPIRKFFNTSGMLYREMQLKDKLPDMTEEEMINLLASDGMLVKRPVLINGSTVLMGFKEKEWEEALLNQS